MLLKKCEHVGAPLQPASFVRNASLEGEVTALLPELDEASQTVTAVVNLPPGAGLVMGAIARLKLQERQQELGYWLPTSALVGSVICQLRQVGLSMRMQR